MLCCVYAYGLIASSIALCLADEEGGDVLLIAALFRAYRIPTDAYRLGLHRAFFKAGQLSVLEGLLTQGVPSVQEENRIVQEVESLVHR